MVVVLHALLFIHMSEVVQYLIEGRRSSRFSFDQEVPPDLIKTSELKLS